MDRVVIDFIPEIGIVQHERLINVIFSAIFDSPWTVFELWIIVFDSALLPLDLRLPAVNFLSDGDGLSMPPSSVVVVDRSITDKIGTMVGDRPDDAVDVPSVVGGRQSISGFQL